MQTWKTKLNAEADKNDDVASNHSLGSRRSNLSAIGDTPFKNLSSKQTMSLLTGERPVGHEGVIHENVDEENESGDEFDHIDDNEGVILTKVERRRMNLLSNRGDAKT